MMISEIKDRWNKATPGPWKWVESPKEEWGPDAAVVMGLGPDVVGWWGEYCDDGGIDVDPKNAEALLKELEEGAGNGD